MTRGNASGFWSLTVLPGGQGFLGRLGAPRDLFEFRVRVCMPGISPWEFRESLIRALFVFCVLIPFLLIKLMK